MSTEDVAIFRVVTSSDFELGSGTLCGDTDTDERSATHIEAVGIIGSLWKLDVVCVWLTLV